MNTKFKVIKCNDRSEIRLPRLKGSMFKDSVEYLIYIGFQSLARAVAILSLERSGYDTQIYSHLRLATR
jgi:hypothetical protein